MAHAIRYSSAVFQDEHLATCSREARLLFLGLWCIADADGQLLFDLERIRREIVPGNDIDIISCVGELRCIGYATLENSILTLRSKGRDGETLVLANASATRRKIEKSAPKSDFTSEQWKATKEYFGFRCAYCLSPLTAAVREHMIPLSRGGDHSADNIVPACGSCNSAKGTKTPLEFISGLRLRGAAE
jgi:5-methylcytosine-specific restriction endonuclease McrA